MKFKTRDLTLLALFTAFSAVFIYLASISPTGQIGLLGAASVFGVAAVIECGLGGGVAVFIISSLLSLLLVPNKTVVLVYVIFFGYYPILKSLAERCRSRVLEWIIKLLVLNTALVVIFFVFSGTVFDISRFKNSYIIAFIVFNAVFIVFDIGVSKLVQFYISKISGKRGH